MDRFIQSDFIHQQEVLHRDFDIDTHRATFVNYLEVIILEDGSVQYAVPSHQEKLIQIGSELAGMDRDSFYNMCPREYWFDVTTWLCKKANAIAVWDFQFEGYANQAQLEKLEELRLAGLYKGPVQNQSSYVTNN